MSLNSNLIQIQTSRWPQAAGVRGDVGRRRLKSGERRSNGVRSQGWRAGVVRSQGRQADSAIGVEFTCSERKGETIWAHLVWAVARAVIGFILPMTAKIQPS
jgi:hypothetical protein